MHRRCPPMLSLSRTRPRRLSSPCAGAATEDGVRASVQPCSAAPSSAECSPLLITATALTPTSPTPTATAPAPISAPVTVVTRWPTACSGSGLLIRTAARMSASAACVIHVRERIVAAACAFPVGRSYRHLHASSGARSLAPGRRLWSLDSRAQPVYSRDFPPCKFYE